MREIRGLGVVPLKKGNSDTAKFQVFLPKITPILEGSFPERAMEKFPFLGFLPAAHLRLFHLTLFLHLFL